MHKLIAIILATGFCFPLFAKWEPIGPYGGNLKYVVVSPGNGNVVYALSSQPVTYNFSQSGKVFKSTDKGNTWARFYMPDDVVNYIALDPNDSNKIYLAIGSQLYRSSDGGQNWSATSTSVSSIFEIKVHPLTSNVYVAGYTSSQLIFLKSADYGGSWAMETAAYNFNSNSRYSNALGIDPLNANNVYICASDRDNSGSYKAIFVRSTNGGSSFTDLSDGVDPLTMQNFIHSVIVNPNRPDIVFIGGSGGLFQYSVSNNSWTHTFDLGYKYFYHMDYCASDPDIMYAGSNEWVYKSTDAGSTWTKVLTGYTKQYFGSVAVDPDDPSFVYSTSKPGIMKSTDGGASWALGNNKLNLGIIASIGIVPSSQNIMYTAHYEGPVYISTNSGTDWTPTGTISSASVPIDCGETIDFCMFDDSDHFQCLEGWG